MGPKELLLGHCNAQPNGVMKKVLVTGTSRRTGDKRSGQTSRGPGLRTRECLARSFIAQRLFADAVICRDDYYL